jgi:hypothetical protein
MFTAVTIECYRSDALVQNSAIIIGVVSLALMKYVTYLHELLLLLLTIGTNAAGNK